MLKKTVSFLIAFAMLSGIGSVSVFAADEAAGTKAPTATGTTAAAESTASTAAPKATAATAKTEDEASVYLEDNTLPVSGDQDTTNIAAPVNDTTNQATQNNNVNQNNNNSASMDTTDEGTGNIVDNSTGVQLNRSADQNLASQDGTIMPNAGTRRIDGTNADGTMDARRQITTNLTENSSKYNGMASMPLPQASVASRYSTSRVALPPDISDTKYAEAAELLGALGIMVGDAETGNFRPEDAIIRSEMAKVAVYSIGLEDIAKSSMGTTKFPDVPADHWATGAINVADQQGMVIGDDVGTFRPDDPVLLQEAVAIIVRALGYEPAAESRGGYPSGYMYVASSNQLLRGINANAADAAKRGDIAQLVFNALTVNLMEQVGFGSDASYEVVDKTLLYDKLNVEKAYGQIVGTPETTLNGGNTTSEDHILIGDNLYLIGDTDAKLLLGYNVLFYARLDKTTDEKTLILVREQANKNRTIRANADDIVSVTGGNGQNVNFEYWESENDRNTKTATIDAKATYIYNGKYKTGVTTADLKPTSGNVTLLDSDTNGTYDIVFVNHFRNLVVDTISTVTGRVTDKYANGSLVFDPNDTTVLYSIIKDNREIGVEELAEWNVLSYTISDDKNLIRAYVSTTSITGTVTEITSKGYRIGDSKETFKKAASYPNDIALRDKGTFYLDIEDNIAAVDTTAQTGTELNKKYAYLVGAAKGDTFETTAQFKMFTTAGKTEILESSNRMRLNDDYGLEPSAVVETLNSGGKMTPQLIIYETNAAGNITAIELATKGNGAPNKGDFTLDIEQDDLIYRSASNKLGNAVIGENTIIFDIPADAGDNTDRYSVRNRGMLSNDTAYDALIYDLEENYTASVVVITSSTGVTAPESPIVVIDHLSETQDEDYQYTDKLYGYSGGQAVEIMAEDKGILVKDGSTALTRGDIIQYTTNADGKIDHINVLFNIANKTTEFSTDVTNDLTTVYGRVIKKFSDSVNLSVNGQIFNYGTTDTTVYLVDTTKGANNTSAVQVVSPADIEIYEEGNEARLFVKMYQDKVQELVIIR